MRRTKGKNPPIQTLCLGPNNSIHLSLCLSYSELIIHFCNSFKLFFSFLAYCRMAQNYKASLPYPSILSAALSSRKHQTKLWRSLVLPTLGKLMMKTTQGSYKINKIILKTKSCPRWCRDSPSLSWISLSSTLFFILMLSPQISLGAEGFISKNRKSGL